MRLLNDARPDDGLLDVAVLSPRTLRHWVSLAWGVLRRMDTVARMETFTAARVEIRSSRDQPRQLDGDLIDPGRDLIVTVRPKALLLCVPQPATDPDLAHDADAVRDEADEVRSLA
jgi:diacylglycerol kinase family enzyme